MEYNEKLTPLSQSEQWEIQKQTYIEMGPRCWTEKKVPCHITSSPFIARSYANIVLSTIEQGCHYNILEVGGGSGKFAFLFLQSLIPKLQNFNNTTISYILTDISPNTLKYWQNHPLLSHYIEKGILEITLLNPLEDTPKTLGEGTTFVIANYFFDSIPIDIYRYEQGVLKKGHVQAQEQKPHTTFLPTQDQVHPIYKEEDTAFTLPTAGYKVIDFLLKSTSGQVFMLVGDKGPTTIEQIRNSSIPNMEIHATFSYSVNFLALAHYIEEKGGEALFPTSPSDQDFTVALFSLKSTFKTFPQLKLTYLKEVDTCSPLDALQFYKMAPNASVERYLSHLKLSNWDPTCFVQIFDQIKTKAATHTLIDAIYRVSKHIFPLTQEEALLYCKLGEELKTLGKKEEGGRLIEMVTYFEHTTLQAMQQFVIEANPRGKVLQIGLGSFPIAACITASNITSHTLIPLTDSETESTSLLPMITTHPLNQLNTLGTYDTILLIGANSAQIEKLCRTHHLAPSGQLHTFAPI